MIYDVLEKLNINYDEVAHKAIYTAQEAREENIAKRIDGLECKNLFLKCKDKYYLVFIKAAKRADLKELAKLVNVNKLTFASVDELNSILKISIGSVTPLGVINDEKLLVKLLIDKDLIDNKLLMHPDTNTKTLSLHYNDLIRFIEYTKHEYILF